MLKRRERSHAGIVTLALAAAIFVTAFLLGPLSVNAQTASGAARHDSASMHSMDMKKSMESMSKEMASMPMTGDPDRDFALMMRIHHQGAIDMSQAELTTGKDPQMRKLAKEIIAAQKKEIALIERWLKKYEKQSDAAARK
jgi:uncharacterized protein (DUF305 family)